MSKEDKINPLFVVPALIFGAMFKQADFTKEQVELFMDFDYYFLKSLKDNKKIVKFMLKHHSEFKKAIIKMY